MDDGVTALDAKEAEIPEFSTDVAQSERVAEGIRQRYSKMAPGKLPTGPRLQVPLKGVRLTWVAEHHPCLQDPGAVFRGMGNTAGIVIGQAFLDRQARGTGVVPRRVRGTPQDIHRVACHGLARQAFARSAACGPPSLSRRFERRLVPEVGIEPTLGYKPNWMLSVAYYL